ncbi:MAG: hypothetical protein A2268_02510 [Candidatus Raymondbacteria bacterium RifOxyA12_full_50_37]|uniref:Uncharacterized protein n=1 Tax=Candidatus Raymondbacteria bacterium RIFOXYD12_FULL_49_13 TaxID=1817890 RepID=A0A1F7FET3_UNCRA|nr:MAG: hypothetical protein A2268_02510 [Candidatus Raymondbacteria bacterium RifOxyA12_full_50_37]OGJ89127.1 MAG: hypothetical protein A2248_11255 [Candidatus Raymondbacteria bacterium RIFOXYA2_FULL_49_16]OGJ96609.1 MAG: hypothetical protein A2453_06370 [Candidatus Raymondbacteria bacterium RIFOXYC2_FULL_50_21]OGK03187.1 MAG: hypothetical protein A2350_13945 [Candidatus Raymondbacteria bacterium RifOxyB12_full_50_8]OGK05153.1 MAG: hypothetical protein A2519_11430 [Candidatus Raymondbacteria b
MLSIIKIMVATALFSVPVLFAYTENAVIVNYIKPAGSSVGDLCMDPLLLTNVLQNELTQTGNFQVRDRSIVFGTEELRQLSATAEYSAYDATILGQRTGTPLVVMGWIRCMGDNVWIKIGLFDTEMEEEIKSVSGSYTNSREEMTDHAIPDLVKNLISVKKRSKANDALAIESIKDTEPDMAVAKPAHIKSSYVRWALIGGALTLSAAYIIELLSSPSSGPANGNVNTEVVATW